MNSVSIEITLITSIFVAGLILCFTHNLLTGMGFIITANIALPGIIKLIKTSDIKNPRLETSKP